jgi:hypothetical protein
MVILGALMSPVDLFFAVEGGPNRNCLAEGDTEEWKQEELMYRRCCGQWASLDSGARDLLFTLYASDELVLGISGVHHWGIEN